ncbi:MAG TPA: hypothetical protein VII00_07395 [bacterium]
MRGTLLKFSLVFLMVVAGCGKARDTYLESQKPKKNVSFPHTENWSAKTEHGLTSIDLGKESCASSSCHGEDLSGGYSQISCDMCHTTYPHENGWITQGTHWQQALAVGTAKCAECHGKDFKGGDTGVSCFNCHTLYPHQEGWTLNHNLYLKQGNYNTSGCATSCHGTDFKGGNSGIACFSCHTSFPHPPGWVNWDSTGHGLYLKTYAWDTGRCIDCHGQDLTGGSAGISCYSCHSTYPHPAENLWLTRSETQFHGNVVNAQGSPSICAQCHGTDYLGKNTGISCYSCHSLYPHDNDWASYTHGDYVNSNGDSSCISCHEDLRAGFSLNPVLYPNCQYCH